MRRISAIVTTYYPSHKVFSNVKRISLQVDRIFICDNSPNENKVLFSSITNAFYIFNKKNLGLSCAFNVVLKDSSIEWNAEDYIIFFDQDSVIEKAHIERLINEFEYLSLCGFDVGCIGPVVFNNINKQIEIPKLKSKISDKSMKVSNIITSSMLCRYGDIRKINFWNEEIFLDFADWDICWRLRKNNKICVMTFASVLNHTVGIGEKKIGSIRLRVGQPIREYYQIRDAQYLIHKKYTPLKYKVKFLSRITIRSLLHIIFLNDKKERFYYIIKGMVDYKKGKIGVLKEQ